MLSVNTSHNISNDFLDSYLNLSSKLKQQMIEQDIE